MSVSAKIEICPSPPRHSPLGMGSLILVPPILKIPRFVRCKYSSGRVPEINRFNLTSSCLSIERFPSSVGRLPTRELLTRINPSSCVQPPSSDGMVPPRLARLVMSVTDSGNEVSGQHGAEYCNFILQLLTQFCQVTHSGRD